ncbi:hypothetical protein CPB86DRAFT_869846 [Serendipita vermifera]|nr:hypothetical protein CPB86DRAFT_869846 [Serendipita vermifera]
MSSRPTRSATKRKASSSPVPAPTESSTHSGGGKRKKSSLTSKKSSEAKVQEQAQQDDVGDPDSSALDTPTPSPRKGATKGKKVGRPKKPHPNSTEVTDTAATLESTATSENISGDNTEENQEDNPFIVNKSTPQHITDPGPVATEPQAIDHLDRSGETHEEPMSPRWNDAHNHDSLERAFQTAVVDRNLFDNIPASRYGCGATGSNSLIVWGFDMANEEGSPLARCKQMCNFTNNPLWRLPFGVVHNPMFIKKEALEFSGNRYLKFKGSFDAAIFGLVGIVENCGVDPSPYPNASEAERSKKFVAITLHKVHFDRLMRLACLVTRRQLLAVPAWRSNLKISPEVANMTSTSPSHSRARFATVEPSNPWLERFWFSDGDDSDTNWTVENATRTMRALSPGDLALVTFKLKLWEKDAANQGPQVPMLRFMLENAVQLQG